MTTADERILERVEELRVLADPTRLRIVEALREQPASPIGLARAFGRKPTALYRHFERLEHAGLIEVAEERQRRGVVERLYRPVANRLTVDRALARGVKSKASVDAVLAAAGTILQITAEDLRAAASDPSRPLADKRRSELGTVVTRVSAPDARRLMSHLRALIDLAEELDGSGSRRIRLTLGLVPVNRGG